MAFTQDERKLRVTTPLGPDKLLISGFTGTEGMSELFHLELDLLAENTTEVAFDRLLGQPITVKVQMPDTQGGFRYFNGICVEVSEGERATQETDAKAFTTFKMAVVPKVWRLTQIRQSRMYQQKSVLDILRDVLTGFTVSYEVQGTFQPRDYCIQYRESDFDFISRLMEEEGIYYFFKHQDGAHTMVIANTPDSNPMIQTPSDLFHEGEILGGYYEEDRISYWRKIQRLTPGKVKHRDHCFEVPNENYEIEKTVLPTVQVGTKSHKLAVGENSTLEHYDFPGAYAKRFDGITPGGGVQAAELSKIRPDGERRVYVRMQQEDLQGLFIEGASNVRHLASGQTFNVKEHFDADGKYLCTKVWHHAKDTYRSGGDEAFRYENRFECIPTPGLRYRPLPKTRRPIVHGTHTGVVQGPPGEEIFTDKYGRVKVKFRWDRNPLDKDDKASCWIRVASSWAGANWGAIHIPRIGQEVVVAFEEGDPDQPIVIGSVYNADMMPPYTLPTEKTKSTLKSRSTLQGATTHFNEIRFEDKKTMEEILIHAEKDMTEEVEHERKTTVGMDTSQGGQDTTWGNETVTIGRNRVTKIGETSNPPGDETLTVYGKRVTSIGAKNAPPGNDELTVSGDRTATIQQKDTLNVTMNRSATIGTSDALTTGTSLAMTAGTTVTITSGGAITVNCGAAMTLNITGALTVNTGGAATVNAGGAVSVSSGGAVSVQAGGAVSLMAGGAVSVTATAIALNAAAVTCAGSLLATAIQTTSLTAATVTAATYSPGVGNLV